MGGDKARLHARIRGSLKEEHTPSDSEDESQIEKRPNLLQRMALTFLGALTGLLPTRLVQLLKASSFRRLLSLAGMMVAALLLTFNSQIGGRTAATAGPREILYSEFLHLVNSGNVDTVRFDDGNNRMLVNIKEHSGSPQNQEEGRRFHTKRVANDPNLIPTLVAAGVKFGAIKSSVSSILGRILVTALALWIPLLPLFFIMRRLLDSRAGGGSKRKKNSKGEVPPTTFADVAGVGAAKEELAEVVACLRDGRKFARLGAKLPSGVLLCGPPGTGKTLLARAVAGEAGVPFMAVSASEFVELFVGRGAARIRELFAEARRRAPCVVFIDELDAVGGKRGAGLNEERDQTLNQLLTELDGFEGRPGVLLLAATNRPEVLDSALLRPGRLSRKVIVPLPDEAGREAILNVHLKAVPFASIEEKTAAAKAIANLSAGFSGADLQNVVNEAAFLAARQGIAAVTLPELIEAVSRTRYGVNGAAPGGFAGSLQNWLRQRLVDSSSNTTRMRTQPLGP